MTDGPIKVAIIGAGSMGALLLDCLQDDPRWHCTSIHDDAAQGHLHGFPILSTNVDALPPGQRVFIAVGDPSVRRKIIERLQPRKLLWQTFIDRRSLVAPTALVGVGTLVLPFAMITSDAGIGSFCIINAYCRVGDGSQVGAFTSIMAGASMGDSTAGKECLLGLNSACLAGAVLEDRVTVAPMTLVRRHVPAGAMIAGNPARIILRPQARKSISAEPIGDSASGRRADDEPKLPDRE